MDAAPLDAAIATIPAGPWAVGVSGGADSVALLALLRKRPDLNLHVVHLDHQTRSGQSAQDARFVVELARQWALPCTIALREQIEPDLSSPPTNTSARYRALRLELYRRVVAAHHLQGVILAHHTDDQAETIFQRLLRSASYVGLSGMEPHAVVNGVTILRPLLTLRRTQLREYLIEQGIAWRDDASNESDEYQRNRVRKLLTRWPAIGEAMIELAARCREIRNWARQHALVLEERFEAKQLDQLPSLLAEESIRRWLSDRGVPPEQIETAVVRRLLEMATDAASSPRQDFPGGLCVRRKGGEIFVDQD